MLHTQRLENVAARLTPEQYAYVLAFAEALATQNTPHGFAKTVTTTRRRLEDIFPQAARLRFRELTRQSEDATLNEAEQTELLALAEKREESDAEWITAAAQLSATYSVPLDQALDMLNLGAKRL